MLLAAVESTVVSFAAVGKTGSGGVELEVEEPTLEVGALVPEVEAPVLEEEALEFVAEVVVLEADVLVLREGGAEMVLP